MGLRDRANAFEELLKLLSAYGVEESTLEGQIDTLKKIMQDRLSAPIVISIVAHARDGSVSAITHNARVTRSTDLFLLSSLCGTVGKQFQREAIKMKATEQILPLELEQTPPPASPVSEII